MKVPLSWLRDYVDVDIEPRELARRITLAGVEAEGVTVTGEGWGHIVVGQVEALAPHPNADRLRLATVETGGERLNVVCGAPNVAAGQKIAFARVGARLIDGHTGQPAVLKHARIRGVESAGMVCSEKELGLSDEHEGILVLPEDAPVGTPLAQYYGDAVIDFSPTPNRPDCLSMLGIAWEAAALTGKAVRLPSLDYEESGEPIEKLARVEILDSDLCPRYIAGVVTGVTVGPSPGWMQQQLKAAGMRPINNVVDITNYVMLEYGQPLHAFDYDLLAERRIVVRRAREGESIVGIDGQLRRLAPHTLVIADAARPVAVAGVMGGAESEVGERTVNILLESATFDGLSIRRTSRELGLRSEASTRFDKGLSPELPLFAARRAIQLMVQLAGGKAAKGLVDVYPGHSARQPIRLTTERAMKVLGVGVATEEMARTLKALGFQGRDGGDSALQVEAPYWRMDIAIEDDLLEEIARIKGYDWIPTTTLGGHLPVYEPEPMLALKEAVRDIMVASGLVEIVTYSLTSQEVRARAQPGGPEPLRVWNPLSTDLEELRLTLRGGLLRTLAANQRNQEEGIHLFEVGKVYLPTEGELPQEREVVAAVLSGPRRASFWQAEGGELDFFDAKGVLEALFDGLGVVVSYEPDKDPLLHPGRTARLFVDGRPVGLVGELHPRGAGAFDLLNRPVAYLEVDLQELLPLLPERGHPYQPIARFPGIVRDLALALDESVPAQRVLEIIRATPLVQQAPLFDVYAGEQLPPGKKSLAYRIVYQSPGRTLTSEEAQRTQDRLLDRLHKELGATLRE